MKIEDIPFRYKAGIPHITVNEETLNHVKIEIHKAGLVAKKAIEDYLIEHPNAQDYGLFGFAWVYTYELTEVTQALLDLNMYKHMQTGVIDFIWISICKPIWLICLKRELKLPQITWQVYFIKNSIWVLVSISYLACDNMGVGVYTKHLIVWWLVLSMSIPVVIITNYLGYITYNKVE